MGEIRFRKVIHRIGRPGLRKNDTEKDSDIGGILTPTDLPRGNWPAHRLSDLRGALKRSLSGRPTCVRDQFWCEVERFVLSRWRRAAICAHEAVTLSERERDRDVCFGSPGAGDGPGGAPRSPQDLKKKLSSKEFQDWLKAQFEKRRKETQTVRARMMQAIGRVLTRNERAKYRKMLGEPFDLKPLQSAAPNISATTLSAPGAAAGDGREAADPKSDQPAPAPTVSNNNAARSKRSQ